MKKLKIKKLILNNFKGIKHFELDTNGGNVNIYGRNATGKTTLFDAFTWLLFGRDSLNRSNFEIKTLDENGKVKQHGLDHSVEGVFELDGKTLTLKRVFREEWTKHRGSPKKTFTGHTTDYFIDDVPVKKKEYDEMVGSIVSDEVFRLLTNPLYFNEQLDQKQRRKILLDMIENVTDEEVATHSGNKDLIDFVERLEGKDIEKYQKSVKSKQKEINDELEKIPVRIDEIELSLPDISGLDENELKAKIESIDNRIAEKHEKINSIRSGGEISELQKQISDIDMQLAKIRNEHDYAVNDEIYRMKAQLQEKESNVSIFETKQKSEKELIEYKQKQIAELNEKIEVLRDNWRKTDKLQFEFDGETVCPTCRQELPDEQVEQARAEAEKQFNEEKAAKLESIVNEANSIKKRIEEINEEIEKMKRNIEKYEEEKAKNEKEAEKLKATIEELEKQKTDITENHEYIAKLKEKEEIERKIAEIRDSLDDAIMAVREEIRQLEDERKAAQSELNKFELRKQSEKRLQELEQREKELTQEYEQLEKELFLAEEFTRAKVDLLEEKINAKFKHARFKLFEEQVNGGLKEVCETTYKGVPYSKGLNNAARINVGLDIINTLSQHYGIQVPIFIDNRESVTDLFEVESQVISLIVSKKHSQLAVETDENTGVEAV